MDTKKFKKDMEVFSFAQHQEFVQYHELMTSRGWTFEDAREFVSFIIKERAENEKKLKARHKKIQATKAKNQLHCPECNQLMQIRPVNINKQTLTGDPSDKSVWLCQNPKCYNVIYNKQTVNEIVMKPQRGN